MLQPEAARPHGAINGVYLLPKTVLNATTVLKPGPNKCATMHALLIMPSHDENQPETMA
jgi:hypothetical protein